MKFYDDEITLDEIDLEINTIHRKIDEIKNNKDVGFTYNIWLLEEYNLRMQELLSLKSSVLSPYYSSQNLHML